MEECASSAPTPRARKTYDGSKVADVQGKVDELERQNAELEAVRKIREAHAGAK